MSDRIAASLQVFNLLVTCANLEEDVQPVHRERNTGVKDDVGRLGVVPHVELCCRSGIANANRAAHEHDPLDMVHHLGIGPQQQGNVSLGGEGDDRYGLI